MGNARTSQRRRHDVLTSPSSSFLPPIRPSASHPSSPLIPRDQSASPEHAKGFGHSFERMAVHHPDPGVIVGNEAEHIAIGETTNSFTSPLASDRGSATEQNQPIQTARAATSTAASSAHTLQRAPAPAGSPDTPPLPANHRTDTKRSGWSLERMAITHNDPSPAQHYATDTSRTQEPSSQGEVLQQKSVEPAAPKKNSTGLPDHLKAGVEGLSGFSLDDVHVHYNSPKPAHVDALAYTQGSEIHVGPGQERHLAHEAWHVVQQKEGRVQPTLQAKGVAINDDRGLEREADVMGVKASNLTSGQMLSVPPTKKGGIIPTGSIQRMIGFEYQLTRSQITPASTGCRPLRKWEPIGAKQNGVSPTAEEVNQYGGHDLEFISDAFDEVDASGWWNLKEAISTTCNIIRQLEEATSAGPRPVSEVLAGGIAGYNVQVPDGAGTLHITAGIQLDRLQTFLTGFSNKTNITSPNPNGSLAAIVPDAVDSATISLTQVETQQGVHFTDDLRNEIFSLVSLLATTMQVLQGQTPYFKALYRLMNRTDMATLVRHVRTRMNAELAHGNHPIPAPHPLLTLIQASLPPAPSLDEPLIPHKPLRGVDYLTWYGSLLSPYSLTRRGWLEQLFNGDDPLSVAWQEQQDAAGVAGAQEAAGLLRSVGSFGGQMDPSRNSIRPVFEIRNIPRLTSVTDLEEWALGVSRYIKAINAGIDQPLVLGGRGDGISHFFSSLLHR